MLRHGHSQLGAAAVGLGAACTANPGVPHIPQGYPMSHRGPQLCLNWGKSGDRLGRGGHPPSPLAPLCRVSSASPTETEPRVPNRPPREAGQGPGTTRAEPKPWVPPGHLVTAKQLPETI